MSQICDCPSLAQCRCWKSWDILTSEGLGAGLPPTPRLGTSPNSYNRLPVLITTSSALEGRMTRRVREPRFPPRLAPSADSLRILLTARYVPSNGWMGGIR